MKKRTLSYFLRNYIPFYYQLEIWVKKLVLKQIKKNYERRRKV